MQKEPGKSESLGSLVLSSVFISVFTKMPLHSGSARLKCKGSS